MRSILRLGFLVLMVLALGSPRAEAGFWDWLEELNGPGPSTGRNLPFMISFLCKPYSDVATRTGKKKALAVLFELPEKEAKTSTCFYFDTHPFNAKDDIHYFEVDSRLWEFGVTTRLHPTVEIGGGLGQFSFNSRYPESLGGEEKRGDRLAVTFPRVVFKPLMAVPWSKLQHPGWGFLQLYFKNTVIKGTLQDEDFANKGNIDFVRTNQRVESVGFTIDFNAVANLIFDR